MDGVFYFSKVSMGQVDIVKNHVGSRFPLKINRPIETNHRCNDRLHFDSLIMVEVSNHPYV